MDSRPPLSSFMGTPPAGNRPALSSFAGNMSSSTPPAAPDAGKKSPGMFGTAMNMMFNPAMGPANPELGVGGLKGVGSTAYGLGKLGSKVGDFFGNLAGKIPGVGPKIKEFINPPMPDKPDILKPKGAAENVGYGLEQIGEFFLPGMIANKAAEGVNAASKLDKFLDYGKLTERFGPDAAKFIKGLAKVAASGVKEGAVTGGVAAVQSGGDVKTTEQAAAAGLIGGSVGKTLELISPGISESLAKANLRLTPVQERNLGVKADRAAQFLSDNKIIGTPARQFNKVDEVYGQFEDAIQASIKDGGTISRDELVKQLEAIPDQFKDEPAIYNKVANDIGSAVETIKTTQPEEISYQSFLKQKRSFGKEAFSKDGSRMVKESQFAISSTYNDLLSGALKDTNTNIKVPEGLQQYFGGKTEVPLKDFNKVYSDVINTRKLLDIAKSRKDVGLMGRLLTAAAGGVVAGPAGAYAGDVAAGSLTTLMRSTAGAAIQSAGSTVPFATKAGVGFFDAMQSAGGGSTPAAAPGAARPPLSSFQGK